MRVNLNDSLIQSSLDADDRDKSQYASAPRQKKESAPEQTFRPADSKQEELIKVEEHKKEESVA